MRVRHTDQLALPGGSNGAASAAAASSHSALAAGLRRVAQERKAASELLEPAVISVPTAYGTRAHAVWRQSLATCWRTRRREAAIVAKATIVAVVDACVEAVYMLWQSSRARALAKTQ
mmetsp:Transcript_21859/g.65391  ORF Transcript_21859/g.65391 Transcript_21859/m.65391 type:complete len:118 (+) Transcript_21859:1853-2206(+)